MIDIRNLFSNLPVDIVDVNVTASSKCLELLRYCNCFIGIELHFTSFLSRSVVEIPVVHIHAIHR